MVFPSRDNAGHIAARCQCLSQMSSDKAASACDSDNSHQSPMSRSVESFNIVSLPIKITQITRPIDMWLLYLNVSSPP